MTFGSIFANISVADAILSTIFHFVMFLLLFNLDLKINLENS